MKKIHTNQGLQKNSEHGIAIVALISVMKKLSMVIILTVLTSISLQAQNIMEFNSYLEQAKSSTDPLVNANISHLEHLINDLQPTAYVGSDIKSIGETQPVCVEVKSADIKKLSIANSLFTQVELITIVVNSPADLNFVLDLSKLDSFTNLKFVYFLCEFECKIEEMQKLYLPKAGITVFYKVSIPS
jgi:hypothetical protein